MCIRDSVPDVPGGLASLLEFLDECDVNVEYGYCMSVEGCLLYTSPSSPKQLLNVKMPVNR